MPISKVLRDVNQSFRTSLQPWTRRHSTAGRQ